MRVDSGRIVGMIVWLALTGSVCYWGFLEFQKHKKTSHKSYVFQTNIGDGGNMSLERGASNALKQRKRQVAHEKRNKFFVKPYKEIPIPQDCSTPASTAHRQPSIPAGWKEHPYVDNAPPPVLSDKEREHGYMLFQRPIIDPVYPNTHPLPFERFSKLSSFGALGENVSFTFSVYPIRKLVRFKVRTSDLRCGETEISQSDICVRLGTYWNIAYPMYYSQEHIFRRAPELIEKVTAHTSPAKECQRYWIRIHVPKNAKPGLYHGNITVWDEKIDYALSIPILFRVLDFTLKQDPKKHYSAYYYMRNPPQYRGKSDSWAKKASDNEYRTMREYGLDMAPTLYLYCNDKERKVLSIKGEDDLNRILQVGLKGPIPITGGNAIAAVYARMVHGGKRRQHWNITKMPPPEFYTELIRMFKAFEKMRKAKGWPEFICCPLDEVIASKKEFGRKVYKAVQDAGIRTYITKDPKSSDAGDYKDCVNIWCSQPYSTPYKEIQRQKKYEYWSYPNHNAGELKNKTIMCKGGRMTYGYGFWRSGFTTLIPWHWSWTGGSPDQFDYLRGRRSGCGQRLTEAGEVIPAVYWVCFREGVDDARYIYTLQQALFEREGSPDKECRKAVRHAEKILQKLWDDIHVQQKYLDSGMWASSEFNARRWLIALAIEKLLKYPPFHHGNAPSVMVADASDHARETLNILRKARQQGALMTLDITGDMKDWINSSSHEGRLSRSTDGDAAFRWTVNIDHKLDASGKKGKYLIDWPLIRREFSSPVDMTKFDYLLFRLKLDSNRDEVSDDTTPIAITIQSNKFFEEKYDLGGKQREWINLELPIKTLIDKVDEGKDPWRKINRIQFVVSERYYKDGTKLQFDIGKVQLVKFKNPVISQLTVPKYVIAHTRNIIFKVALLGYKPDNKTKIKIVVFSSKMQKVFEMTKPVEPERQFFVVNPRSLLPGKYSYLVSTINDTNKVMSQRSGEFHILLKNIVLK